MSDDQPHWLNRGQFRQLTSEANTIPEGETETGFSVAAKQGPSGEIVRAADRYMVGGVPGQVGQTHGAPMKTSSMVGFARANQGLLSQPEHYMGGWHEGTRPGGAAIDLDVSQGFPRTDAGVHAAKIATITRNERAFGEVDVNADYAGTHTNPYSTRILGDPASEGGGVAGYLNQLRSDPQAYADTLMGHGVSGMAAWSKRPVDQS